jgi:hypothetical protein
VYGVGPFTVKQFKNSLNLRCVCTNTTEILLPNCVIDQRKIFWLFLYHVCGGMYKKSVYRGNSETVF